MARRHALGLGLAVAGLVATAVAIGSRSASGVSARPGGQPGGGAAGTFLALLAAAFVVYVVALAAVRRLRAAALVPVLVVAAAVQLLPLTGPLLLSTDVWTYWSYGWLGTHGHDPYVVPPVDVPGNPALDAMGADWRGTTTVYGPAFTLASEPIALAAGTSRDAAALAFRILAAAAALACAGLAASVARRKALAAAFVGWNPVLAIHLAGGGHNDGWVAALLAAALALSARRRLEAAGVAWSLAVLVKWVPVVFLLLRAVEARATARPVRHAGFAAATLGVLGLATWRYGLDWVKALEPLAANARRKTAYALPSRLESTGVPESVALGLAGVSLLIGLAFLVREARRGRALLARCACLLLLTTPYLAVWYLAWPAALAAADDDDRVARILTLGLTAYLLPQAIPL